MTAFTTKIIPLFKLLSLDTPKIISQEKSENEVSFIHSLSDMKFPILSFFHVVNNKKNVLFSNNLAAKVLLELFLVDSLWVYNLKTRKIEFTTPENNKHSANLFNLKNNKFCLNNRKKWAEEGVSEQDLDALVNFISYILDLPVVVQITELEYEELKERHFI